MYEKAIAIVNTSNHWAVRWYECAMQLLLCVVVNSSNCCIFSQDGNAINDYYRNELKTYRIARNMIFGYSVKNEMRHVVEPVLISSTADAGSRRGLTNHVDAVLDYCLEQEVLKRHRIAIE